MANTPLRSIRIPDEIWDPALEATMREGTTITEIVKRALDEYAKAHPAPRKGTKK
jgi:hypothetical protein